MERRCVVCGQVPDSAFSYPENKQQALKWQSMLATYVPVKILMDHCCVCNKHIYGSIEEQRLKTNVALGNRLTHQRAGVTFSKDKSVHYFGSKSPCVRENEAGSSCDGHITMNGSKTYPPKNEGITAMDNIEHRNDLRHASGYDRDFTGCNNQSHRKSMCPKENRRSANNGYANPLNRCPYNKCCSQCKEQGSRRQNRSERSRSSSPQNFKPSCKPCISDYERRPPVNVLIMGGSMVPSYYNNDLKQKSSDISQIRVLESDFTKERAFFPDIDVPTYSVCRSTEENRTADKRDTETTEVLLVGIAPERKCLCSQVGESATSKPSNKRNSLTNPKEQESNVQEQSKQKKSLDELESLLTQQQQIQQSIQAKLNELREKNKPETPRPVAGTSSQLEDWSSMRIVHPKFRVLRCMMSNKTP